ncbi:MAG TPA: DUF669 domain-containing protein [Phycisphaerales bacterium]|nr:DUF669 domain-containing protein [Phycisphaerales bacterium]
MTQVAHQSPSQNGQRAANFTFNPHANDTLLPRGRHEGEILAAETRVSKAGNPMLELTIGVYGPNGERVVRDWLVATPRSTWKIKNFCQALGLDFDSGRIDAAALPGKRVGVIIEVDQDAQGISRNMVNDYESASGQGRPGRTPGLFQMPKPEGPQTRNEPRPDKKAGGEENIPF